MIHLPYEITIPSFSQGLKNEWPDYYNETDEGSVCLPIQIFLE